MWILPKQLIISPFVLDTEELISDSNEQSQAFAQSCFLRSSPSLLRTWSLKWKRDSWTQHLSGRTLKPSLGMDFLERWTSSLEGSPANHSVVPESVMETKIPVTYSPLYWTALEDADLQLFSWKTLKESSPQNLQETTGETPQEPPFCSMSSANWNGWVTKLRQAYSARLKSAHLTRGSGSSSWPTVTATEARQGFQDRSRGMKGQQESLTMVVVKSGLADRANLSSVGSRQESWVTPQSRDAKGAEGQMIREGNASDLPSQTEVQNTGTWNRNNGKLNPRWVETLMGLPVGWVMPSCVNPITPRSEPSPSQGTGSWPTASMSMTSGYSERENCNSSKKAGHVGNELLRRVIQSMGGGSWMTPEAQNSTGYQVSNGKKILRLGSQVMETSTSPVTIAQTNSDSSETELFQQ